MKKNYYSHIIVVITYFLLFDLPVIAQEIIDLNPSYTMKDSSKKLIISNIIPEIEQPSENTYFQYSQELFRLVQPISKLQFGVPYQLNLNHEIYTLYFSELPLFNALSYQTINTNSDDLVPGKVEISDAEGFKYSSFIGIKVRGKTSRSYPKKSYQIRLWTDSASYETKDESFFKMRDDDKWLLLAMWNEQTRLNNVFCHDLWLRMHQLYYADLEPKANSTIRLKYVELFLNDSYQGVYAFTEGMDRKQLKLKKNKDGIKRGELYKGISWGKGLVVFNMKNVPPYDNNSLFWDGFEMKYPSDLPTDWSLFNDFAYFVSNSTNDDFDIEIFDRFHKMNAIDYYIFLNFINAADNTGKNTFIAKYKEGGPYFYIPWDLDGTIGYNWKGEQDPGDIHNIKWNHLYERIMNRNVDNFNIDMAERWNQLKKSILNPITMKTRIDSIANFLINTGAYEREEIAWSDYKFNIEEIDYIKNWMDERIDFLDKYFNQWSISSKLSINQYDKVRVHYRNGYFSLNPNDLSDDITYKLFNISGQQLLSGILSANSNKISASGIPNGIYIFHFFEDNQNQIGTSKVIKY